MITTRRRWAQLSRPLQVAISSWVVARLFLGTGWIIARVVRPDSFQVHRGLFAWDGGWYQEIAQIGYGHRPLAIRFFPLFPMSARWLPDTLAGPFLVVVANAAALLAAYLLYRSLTQLGIASLAAERAVWMFALWPASLVLGLAYSESLFIVFVLTATKSVEQGRSLPAFAAAMAAALTRSLGVLLVVFAAVAIIRRSGKQQRAAVAMAIGATSGLVAFLGWTEAAGYGWRAPSDAQRPFRGDLVDPFRGVGRIVVDFFGRSILDGLHLPFVVFALLALFWMHQHFTPEYTALAGSIIAISLTGQIANSFERYLLMAPWLFAAIAITSLDWPPRWWKASMAFTSICFVGMTTLVFMAEYVP